MNRLELINAIKDCEATTFRREYLFDDRCWIFDAGRPEEVFGDYLAFRNAIANITQVDIDNVRLVGSSKLGWSLHPEKEFKACNEQSDLDVVIVSEDLFLEITKSLREAYFEGYSWVRGWHGKDIFLNHVFLRKGSKAYQTRYLREMSKRLGRLSLAVFQATGLSRDLNYRIYKTWDDAHAYYDYNIAGLKERINNGPK